MSFPSFKFYFFLSLLNYYFSLSKRGSWVQSFFRDKFQFFCFFNFVLFCYFFVAKKEQLFNWTEKKLEWNFGPFISPPLRTSKFHFYFFENKTFPFCCVLFYFSWIQFLFFLNYSIPFSLNLKHVLKNFCHEMFWHVSTFK